MPFAKDNNLSAVIAGGKSNVVVDLLLNEHENSSDIGARRRGCYSSSSIMRK